MFVTDRKQQSQYDFIVLKKNFADIVSSIFQFLLMCQTYHEKNKVSHGLQEFALFHASQFLVKP